MGQEQANLFACAEGVERRSDVLSAIGARNREAVTRPSRRKTARVEVNSSRRHRNALKIKYCGRSLVRLKRLPVTQKITGLNPVARAN